MSDQLYQVVEDTQFEMKFIRTTLEECYDVVYTGNEIKESFPNIQTIGWSLTHFVKIPQIIQEVKKQFENPKLKIVDLGLSGHANDHLRDWTEEFHEQGIMFSHKLKVFKRWNKPKARPMVVSSSLLNDLRKITCSFITNHLNEEFGIELDFPLSASKERQLGLVKLYKKLGGTIESILDLSGTTDWYINGRHVPSNIHKQITSHLNIMNQSEMYEATMKSYKNWFNSPVE